MKKFISLIALILSTTFFLSGCTPRIMVIPGSDSFYIVQYIYMASDVSALEDLFFLWAGAVEVE